MGQQPAGQMPMGIQYDEQGRPFTYVGGTTRRSYISPVAMGTGTRPTAGGGPFKTDYGWDQNKGDWTRGIDWGNVLTTGIGAVAGGAALAPLFAGGGAPGGAAAAAGNASVLPSATTFPTAGMLPAGGTGLGSAGSAAAGGAVSAGAQAGSSSILSKVLKTLGAAAPMVGAMTAPKQSLQGGVNDIMGIPGVKEMLDLKMGQARRADPLHEALTTMSMRLLPNSARGGM